MFRDFLIVGVGSFFGGGLRFLVSKLLTLLVATPFPVGTFVVNILGCLLIGYFSALPSSSWVTPLTRLLLTTGCCGGFTTFSTFMKESDTLFSSHLPLTLILYLALSIVLGMIAVWVGYRLAR